MSFYVGQKVRVKYCYTPLGRDAVGKEAVICEIREFDGLTGYGLDISPIDFDAVRLGWIAWRAEQLEPLAPPHEPGSWEIIERLMTGETEGTPA